MSDHQSPNEPKRGTFAKEKGEVIIREHVYDGIEEYDQKLPNWWLFTFYGAIAWFLAYWVLYYNAGASKTDHQRVTARMDAVQQKKQEQLAATLASLDNETLINEWAGDPAIVAAGEAIFTANCTACHGADLTATMDVGGVKIPLPGLPLNDGEWKFGGQPMDIFKLVNEGSPPESDGHNGAKMQAWGQTLSPQQIAEVTAYVVSKVPDFQ